ncbi:hypothetical protein Q5H80_03075 [Vibrio sp. SNU_ST1]|uniref:hypothetical protein n=1 Tax=Vibrio sp. SNU_ST1 TaxID=3064001 RepID=UPI00272D8105|nr:hypothetical protein [Vibrio sp. SNU_ST1]WKY58648.1 hypothetical protein Q5H80_03075 [Vibrio sp. SNU_ST1]
MAAYAGNVNVFFGVSDEDFRKGMKEIEKQARESLGKAEGDFVKFGKTTEQQSKGVVKNVRYMAGQMGYQMQDVAVQLQQGTNAWVVFGQQGSQIAGAFGAGGAIIGALIAVGAAVGSVATATAQSTDEIESNISAWRDLSNEQQRITKLDIEKKIKDYTEQLADANIEQTKIKNEIKGTEQAVKRAENQWLNTSYAVEKFHAATNATSDDLLENQRLVANLEADLKKLQASYDDLSGNTTNSRDAFAELNQQYADQINTLGLNDRELSKYEATQRLGIGATEAQIQATRTLIDAYYDQKAALESVTYGSDSLGLGISEAEIKAENALIASERKKYLGEQKQFNAAVKQLEQSAQQDLQAVALGYVAEDKSRIEAQRNFDLLNLQSQYDEKLQQTEAFRTKEAAINAKYDQQRQQAELANTITSFEQQQAYYQAIAQLGNQAAAGYSQVANDLKGATDEEADAIKKAFLLEQASAAATATISYYATLASISQAKASIDAVTLGVGGAAYFGVAQAQAATTLGTSLAGIAATSLGGVASFEVGTEYLQDDGLIMAHRGERIVQSDINKDLSQFLDSNKSGMPKQTVINAPLNIPSGAIIDPKAFNKMLIDQRNTILAAQQKAERERPTKKRR